MKNSKRLYKNQSGMSLIELMVTITIASILMAIAFGGRSIMLSAATHEARLQIIAALEQAKSSSITFLPCGVGINASSIADLRVLDGTCNGGTKRCYASGGAGPEQPGVCVSARCEGGNLILDADDTLITAATTPLKSGIVATFAGCPTNEVYFSRRGIALCADGSQPNEITITVSHRGDYQKAIIVGPTGKISTPQGL